MRRERGITLIALIITIIIMLILVAATITILINTGIMEKAQDAADETELAYQRESMLGKNINIGGNVYNDIDSYLAHLKAKKGMVKSVYNTGYRAYILKENGELYFYVLSGTTQFVKFEQENAILIARNVKDVYDNYYLTNTNEYCYYDIDYGTSTTIANNVKEIYGAYYLTTTNNYCYYNWETGTGTIASNVKKGSNGGNYITTTNDYYYYNGTTSIKIASNVKEGLRGYYLTTTNDYYRYNGTTSTKIASNVKEGYGDYYLTTTNDYCFDDVTLETNVKEGWNDGYYLTMSDELWYLSPYTGVKTKIASNVKELGRGTARCYILNSGDIYLERVADS